MCIRDRAHGADEIVSKAKSAVMSAEEIEGVVENEESNYKGRRERRVVKGGEGMDRLEMFVQTFATSVAVMRGGSWLDKSLKRASITDTLSLAVCILAEMTSDPAIIRAIVANDANVENRRQVTAIVNAMLVLIVGNMLAVLGAGKHLAASLAELFMEEKQDLQRLMLLMWYLEIGGKKGKEFVADFVRHASHFFCIQLVTIWLVGKYIVTSSFSDCSKEDIEALLRIAAEEQQRRMAQSRLRESPKKTSIQIKDEVERIVQKARSFKEQRSSEDEQP